MNVKQIYERVSLVTPIWQRHFFDRLNDTLIELGSMYGDVPKLLYIEDENGEYPDGQWVKELETQLVILPLYHASIIDNILYLSGAGEEYQAEFIRKSHAAWLNYWNKDAKDRRVMERGKGACRYV